MTITPLYFLNTTDALALLTEFGTATDEQSIMTLLRSLCLQMGFDHFRLVFISPSSIQRPDVRIFNGCPADWVQVYNERDFLTVDPVVRKGMAQSTPILWANLITECCDQQNAAGLEVMMLAQEAGLRDGITIPWHGPNGHVGLLSLITCTRRTEYEWLSAIPFLCWLATHIFEAVARIGLADAAPHEPLSLRELEVCQWAAEGKQVSDIAKVLGITPRTVTFHLERIVEKLGASSKDQAISLVLKQGMVRLNIDAAQVRNIDAGGV
ncbi:LuxR family transcriptional regulator [Aeromonas veronii]|uniref:LuxR family transcriptional regulator n=1 Tax=Aeromonas veronii TaxID=654 RepID=A0A3A9IBN2_AERVE|nr:LuxR family transcriptional regulator [Aeromonas veronii]RKJ87220.1 LuxR family transcriptional regulator [Aeromonas veronii]RKJ89479.1 LuxR family transcriptional regulator [Aeromonas veronii]